MKKEKQAQMNRLILYQNQSGNEYNKQLKCIEKEICAKSYIQSLSLETISEKDFVDKNIDVVISTGLPSDWYCILRRLQIVTITIDDLASYRDSADIVIDCKSDDERHCLSGKEYDLRMRTDFNINEYTELISKSEWDSNFFNFPVAYLRSRYLTDSIYYRIKKFIREEKIRLVEYLCNCHDARSVIVAEKNDFHFVDMRLTFKRNICKEEEVGLPHGMSINLAVEKDIPFLREISSDAYIDSRYYFDSNFDNTKVVEFYKSWVEKAVLGKFDHECLCLFNHEKPIGYVTIRYIANKNAQIGLIGISKMYRGQNLGKKILNYLFNYLFKKGINKIFVVTQGRNYYAQRLYQGRGFVTDRTELWFHKWI